MGPAGSHWRFPVVLSVLLACQIHFSLHVIDHRLNAPIYSMDHHPSTLSSCSVLWTDVQQAGHIFCLSIQPLNRSVSWTDVQQASDCSGPFFQCSVSWTIVRTVVDFFQPSVSVCSVLWIIVQPDGDRFSTIHTFCVIDHHLNSCWWPFVKSLTFVQFFLGWTIAPHTSTSLSPYHHRIYPINSHTHPITLPHLLPHGYPFHTIIYPTLNSLPPTTSQVCTTGSTNLWFPQFVLRGSVSLPVSLSHSLRPLPPSMLLP